MARPQRPKRSLLNRLLLKFREAFVFRSEIKGQHGPISIVNLSLKEDADEFVAIVEKALLLLGSVHPRGYRRVKKEIRYIANAPLASYTGSYDESLKVCKIDFDRFSAYASEQNSEWTAALLASILVHEATHGRLRSCSIPYDSEMRVRVERLCKREEVRFVSRLRSDTYDPATLITPFDESYYNTQWNKSRWQRMKDEFALIRQRVQEMRQRDS